MLQAVFLSEKFLQFSLTRAQAPKIRFEKYEKVEKIKIFEISIAKQMQDHNQLLTILIKIPMKF